MSPASSGVERYVGARLYAKRAGDVWAGGMPLIAFGAQQHSPWRAETKRGNLSHLVVHAQGAPLVLANRRGRGGSRKADGKQRYENRPARDGNANCDSNIYRSKIGCVDKNSCRGKEGDGDGCGSSNRSNDAVSVASDESSGSGGTNGETCLPRIIKPRKRRKKDRKPQTEAKIYPQSYWCAPEEEKLLCYEETPKLHHSFEDIEEGEDVNGNTTTCCQCKYCDPSCQIWDMESSSSSSSSGQKQQVGGRRLFRSYSDEPWMSGAESSRRLDDLFVDFSNFSLEEASFSPRSASEGSSCEECGITSRCADPRFVSRSASFAGRDLEVSTEIVTSPNGHRDIEIKFFTAAAAAAAAADLRSHDDVNIRLSNEVVVAFEE